MSSASTNDKAKQEQSKDSQDVPAASTEREESDEPDEWDKRIFSTGCADENAKLLDCHFEKKDWRLCKEEMETFRQCWKLHGNDERTDTKDN